MELALSGALLRSFFKSVGCLAKIGAEVLVEASAGTGLTLKSMNSARSAFCSVTFKQQSFEVFTVPGGTVQTAVLAKHLAAAMRTQRLERVVLSQDVGDQSTLRVKLECGRAGLTKQYGLHCVTDAEHLKAMVDPSLMPISLILKPKEFSRLLSHFQSQQTDVTVSFTPASHTDQYAKGDFSGGFSEKRFSEKRKETSNAPTRNLRLTSFCDPNAPAGQHLQTSIGLDTAEDAVLRYTYSVNDEDLKYQSNVSPSVATEVTVNLKDLRAMVTFCESVDLDVAIYADSPGAPMLVRPTAEFRGVTANQQYCGDNRYGNRDDRGGHGGRHNGNYFDAAAVDFDAELVLASMLPRSEEQVEPTETLGGTRLGETREQDSVAPGTNANAGETMGRRSEISDGRGANQRNPSMSAAIPDSEAGGSQPSGGRAEGHSMGTQNVLCWAPGAPTQNAAEEDDWDLGGDFVEVTPPDKRRRT